MSGDDLYEEWNGKIERAARFVAADFPEVEKEDLAQDLWEFVLKTPALKPDIPGAANILEVAANKIAWKTRKEALHSTAQYSYRPSDVKKLLEDSFGDPTRWEQGFIPEDAQSEERFDGVIMRLDVRAAMRHLPLQYAEAIYDRFAEGVFPQENKDRVRLTRAVQRLADVLNFYQAKPVEQTIEGHPGSRRARSSASFRAHNEG